MPFVEGGIVVDAEQPQQQAAPQAAQGGFVEGGITVDPTPDDSYNMVLQYNAAQTDYVPSKQEFLDYLKVSKTKPLLGEKPLETIGTAAVQTVEDIASMPYKLGEAIGQYMDPPEGVTPMQLAGGTAAEIAVQSRLKAENMGRGLIDTALNKLSDITGKLRNDDDKYEAFLAAAEIKRQLARANAPGDQRVPASQDVLQAYGIPEEAISQQGLDVGGFLADPSSIAFAGGGKLASALAQRAIPLIPRAGQVLQRAGERISNLGRVPENMAGRFTAGVTGSEQMGQAVQEGIAKGTTGITLGEAAGLPITMNVPGLGTIAKTITATKGLGGTMETVGEAGAVSGGPSLTATQRGLLGAGESIAAAEGASSRARALGTALARSGLETPVRGAATILLPMVGAGAAGGALAALTGEEGDAVAAAIGSGAGFGVFDGGFTLAKAVQANAFNGARVRQTAVDDLNTRPTDVQFTYIDPVAGEQTATIKDSEARATLYGRLNNKQLTKALSEVAGAEGAGVDVIFHTDGDTVPAGLQTVNYAGVAIGPDNIKSGKPTILINVDKASPEALPHEILHARITQDMVSQLGAKAIDAASADPNFQRQFTDFANKYADKLQSAGGSVVADRIRTELRDAFDPAQQRAQKIESLKRITDEFAAYYTQEMLKGKDPKTMLPGRIPSFFEMALNNAKEAVSERFTRRALQAGFDPVARTFYDANGRRIKLDWMEDAIKNLITPKEGYEPTEQKVDINKMTQAQQNAVIMARGYSDLFMTAPDGSIVRPLSKAELIARTADIANRTMQVVESVPQAERTSISGMDAYGNPVIEGRLSLAEADAVSKSGIFGPSSSRTLIDIATAIRNGTLMEGNYWKVYGSTGRSGVFGESQKLFLPYGISINSKGGVNVKVVDWGKVQARMYKALSKPAYKSLFNNYDQAMSTMRDVYLKNIAETGAVPSAEALGGGIEGAKKRNMFNEIMGAVPRKGDVMVNFPTAGYVANRKGGSVYQDLRLERIQNADTTSAQIPWTGDMGEQSSYRRTQLNFMPAEAIGETKVSTDDNAGYRILSKNGKFRLYGPDGSTVGIFDTQEQAKLKAEKDYATQERLQPEVRQQQRPLGDEGRQATEAGGRNRIERGQEGQGQGGAVRQEGDVGKTDGLAILDGDLQINLPKRPTVMEIATALQDRFGEPIDWKKSTNAQNKTLRNAVAQEAIRAVDLHPEAKGWYDENIKLTVDVLKELDPDISKPENDFIFKILLAATSDGNKVRPQFLQSWDEYTNWKNTGKISGQFVSGDRVSNIRKNLFKVEAMIQAVGWEKLRDFLTKKGTVAEIREALVKDFGLTKQEAANIGTSELVDEVVPYAIVLGPKLGSFFNNLYGDFSSVTMDRWFMRTMGRLTGTQVDTSAFKKVRSLRATLRESISNLTSSEKEFLKISSDKIKGDNIDAAAKSISTRFAKKETRDRAKQLESEGRPFMEEVRKRSNALKKIQSPLVEAPLNGRHRRWIRQRIAEVQGELKSRGIELENADLQAVLWYLEKELYDKLNYRAKPGDSDYASAAAHLYERVVGQPSSVYAGATGRIRAVGGGGPDVAMGAANPAEAGAAVAGQRYMPAGEAVQGAPKRYESVDSFREHWNSLGVRNMTDIRGKGAPDEHIRPSKIEVDKASRNQGLGTAFMQDLTEFADSQGMQIRLNPSDELGATSKGRLEKFYKRFGFVENKPGKNKDYAISERFYRQPSSGERFMPSDTDYLSAVKQGDTKAAQQMVDEAAKAAGYTTKVFHGSISQFNKPNTPLFLGDEGTAMSYAQDRAMAYGEGANPVTYKIYAKFKNTASESDVKQAATDLGLQVENDMAYTALDPQISGSKYVSRVISELKKRGYDSANIDDFSPDSAQNVIKSFVAFDPSQLKRSDPITKDDAGNVIPLSKRFQKTSDDIRYMPSDDEYLNAVKRGSTKAAQDMVDAAAKAAGYTIGPVYHGTPTGGFNVFDKRMRGETSGVSRQAFSFTTDKKAAEGYSKRLGDEAVRLDAGLRVANDAMRMFDEDIAAQEYFSSKGYSSVDDGMLPEFDWGSIDDVPEFIKELRGYAKDLKPINANLANSFVEAAKVMASTKAVPEVKRVFLRIPENAPVFQATPATLGQVMSGFSAEKQPSKAGIVELPGGDRIYYVADSSQVKLADPVTKDLDGNVIPLSQRFKATSEDIRYMPAGDMATGRSVKDYGEAVDLFEKGYRIYGAPYDGMEDPIRLKKVTEIEKYDPENLWAVPSKKIAAAISIRNMPAGLMPSPDSAMPGAYSFPGGYRALPGKAKGSLRIYGPAGSLIGIASSLDEAQRILRRKGNR